MPIATTTIQPLKIGPYTVHAIPTGLFGLDGGAMFGTVPKVLWQKNHPADAENRIPMEARALLLVSSDKKILIDTGNGDSFIEKYGEKMGTKFSQMYAMDPHGPNLKKSLANLNIKPSDITDVILTHLHFDHCGGSTEANENSLIVPTFKNATYYVQHSNYMNALNPNKREKASYLKANFEPLMTAKVLKLLTTDTDENLPNIRFFVSDGHTQGHQSVIIADDHQQLIYCGDVIPTASHIRSAWVMGYDLNPLKIMDEKNKLLQLSQNKKTYYFFEHDPYCDLATVQINNDDYQVEQAFQMDNTQ